jgi:hypothetical protein
LSISVVPGDRFVPWLNAAAPLSEVRPIVQRGWRT